MSLKLYEISDAFNDVVTMIDEGVPGLEEALASINYSFNEKAESIIKLHRSKVAESDAIKAEIDRLKRMADKLDKDAIWLANYVETEMKRANVTEIKSTLFKIKLGMNPPKVDVFDVNAIPEEFTRTNISYSPDKIAIKEALLAGKEVPGCRIEQELKLKIK